MNNTHVYRRRYAVRRDIRYTRTNAHTHSFEVARVIITYTRVYKKKKRSQ